MPLELYVEVTDDDGIIGATGRIDEFVIPLSRPANGEFGTSNTYFGECSQGTTLRLSYKITATEETTQPTTKSTASMNGPSAFVNTALHIIVAAAFFLL